MRASHRSIRLVTILRALAGVALFASAAAHAQVPAPRHAVSGGNVYLGGQAIELALAQNGGLGPVGAKPAGFIGTPFDAGVLLSTDLDGFGVGAELPNDYFLAGNPEERWVAGFVKNGVNVMGSASARAGNTGDIRNVGLYDESSGSQLQARTVGMVRDGGVDNLEVSQIISFADNAHVVRVQVKVKNVSAVRLDNVRYMRTLDPDNTALYGGMLTTENSVLASFRNGDAMDMVQAQTWDSADYVGTSYGSRAGMFLMTKDARGRASRLGLYNTDPFVNLAWDSPALKSEVNVGDERLSMTFAFGAIAAGASAQATFWISLDGRAAADVMATTDFAEPASMAAPTTPNLISAPTTTTTTTTRSKTSGRKRAAAVQRNEAAAADLDAAIAEAEADLAAADPADQAMGCSSTGSVASPTFGLFALLGFALNRRRRNN